MKYQERLHNVFRPLRDEIRELEVIAKQNKEILQWVVSKRIIDTVVYRLRSDILVNLTDYTATNSLPRHQTIEEAFWILDYIMGFDYNPKGSFTRDGAKRAMSEDIIFRPKRYRLTVEIKGRIEDLEKGDVDWGALRRFFYSDNVKSKIKLMFPNAYRRIYQDLASLFSFAKDPNMPGGRPYIHQAMYKNTEYMHEAIQKWVINVFGTNSEDGWVRTR